MKRSAVREIQGIGRFKFREAELEEFKRLSPQLMEIVRSQDAGTLQYEIYARHLGDLGRAIPGLVSSELLGEPSDDVRAKLVGSGVRLFTPFLSL